MKKIKLKKKNKNKKNHNSINNNVNNNINNNITDIDDMRQSNSKEDCLNIINKSIEKYIDSVQEIYIDNKDEHYKTWLFDFSVDDFKNEFNNKSGNFYNNIYHNIWDDYFDTNGFIIINMI